MSAPLTLAAAAAQPAPRVDRRRLGLLAAGHAVTDSYGQSLLAPLYPLLASRLDLSLAEIGALAAIMGLSASLGQPLWGYLSDRWPRVPLIAIGPAVAAVFCTSIGFATDFASLAVTRFPTGMGVGAFHPQAASLARQAGRGGGLAMSAFTVGGNVGFGLAPLLGALYLNTLGLEQFHLAARPGLLFAGVLLFSYRIQPRETEAGVGTSGCETGTAVPLALGFLTATVIVRSAVQIGMTTFLPFLADRWLPGMDPAVARGVVVSSFLLASALSGPLGGYLSDRLGRKPVMYWSFLLAPWPMLLAFQLPGAWFLPSMALGGFILMLPHPANVVMAQEYLPRSAGIAASLITGLAWGIAQLLARPLGIAAEQHGIVPALVGLSLAPLLGVVLVAPLPATRRAVDAPRPVEQPS